MPTYHVYAHYTATRYLGEVDAASPAEAIAHVQQREDFDEYVNLCWQCAEVLDMGDTPRYEAQQLT